jgi:hypothetical protein
MDKNEKLFPTSISPSEVLRARDEARAPGGARMIMVSVVDDAEDERTRDHRDPIAVQTLDDEELDEEPSKQDKTERSNLGDMMEKLALAETQKMTPYRDSDPSLISIDEVIEVEPPKPDSQQTDPAGTVRHVPLTLSRQEVHVIKRTFQHAARRDPLLAGYFVRKARKHGVPDERIERLLVLFGLPESDDALVE